MELRIAVKVVEVGHSFEAKEVEAVHSFEAKEVEVVQYLSGVKVQDE